MNATRSLGGDNTLSINDGVLSKLPLHFFLLSPHPERRIWGIHSVFASRYAKGGVLGEARVTPTLDGPKYEEKEASRVQRGFKIPV